MKKVPHTMIERFFLTIALVSFPLTLMAQVAGGEVKRLRPSKPVKEVIITNDTKKQENSKKVNVSQKTKGLISCPDSKHPHMIDLGLPSGTLWACCNVGAKKPEDYGGHYAWGETKTKSTYKWSTYIHCDGTKETCHNLGSDIAGTAYDAAIANWGKTWMMPTKEQFEELKVKTTSVWTTQNDVNGYKFTSSNGGTIFLPAAGSVWDGELYYPSYWGYYWSSTPYDEYCTFGLYFRYDYDIAGFDWYRRSIGLSVRPVRK